MFPNFLIVGAQKSGTTYLWEVLRQHPEVYLPEQKEINFFKSSAHNYNNGLNWYSSFFEGAENFKLIGEASPRYMFYPEVVERIYLMNPNIKLVFILRNPIDRAYSHYWHNVIDGHEYCNFFKAIKKEVNRIARDDFSYRAYSYVARGMYYNQILEFLKFFPIENMHFIIFENFIKNTTIELAKLFSFLDIGNNKIDYERNKNVSQYVKFVALYYLFKNKNTNKYFPLRIRKFFIKIIKNNSIDKKPKINSRAKEFLKNKFSDENKQLSALIGRDTSHWI